ncbi:Na+/H+ antiporter NhaC [uncultured Cloacibacillus sp.]|uniref:Na+/H+ antiporter NhaC n=1 Tax=uncultured Cloacibacillus sp. TaxID=889794 RepID=UPI0035A63557
MAENRTFRKPTLAEAVIVVLALFLPITIGNIIFGYNIILMLLVAGSLASLMAMRIGWRWKEIETSIIKHLDGAMPCVFILFMIGVVVASFIFAGSIPMLIYYGMHMVNPKFLILCSLLICSVLSVATGSSWTSAGTAGVALMGIAMGLEVPLSPVLGAIVAGAVIGDKLSPLSDTTNLAAMATGVYLYDHIRSMLWTTVPAFIVAAVIYTVYGLTSISGGSLESENVTIMLRQMDQIYNWNILLMIPFVIMIGGALLKYPAVPCMFGASLVAIVLGVYVQGFSFADGVNCLMSGFKVSMATSSGIDMEAISPAVLKLLHRGGLNSMFFTICIVISAYTYTGIAQGAGYFDILLEHLVGKKASQGMTVLIAVISGIFLTIFGGISYIPIIMLGTLFKKPFLRHNLDLSNLSCTCEDTGTMFIACVPWASSGVYYHGVFGVSVLTFAPWIIISFICPVLAVIYGYTGFGMKKISPEEAKRQLAALEAEDSVIA